MAKFIEVNILCSVSHRVEGEDVFETVKDLVLINTDKILTITPLGEQCIIALTNGESMTAAHSALWVIGLINCQQ
jgi:hypothetical protein